MTPHAAAALSIRAHRAGLTFHCANTALGWRFSLVYADHGKEYYRESSMQFAENPGDDRAGEIYLELAKSIATHLARRDVLPLAIFARYGAWRLQRDAVLAIRTAEWMERLGA